MEVSSSRLSKCPRLMEKANPSNNPAAVNVAILKKKRVVRASRETALKIPATLQMKKLQKPLPQLLRT